VHGATTALLEEHGYAVRHLASKRWKLFAAATATKLDMVITIGAKPPKKTDMPWPGAPVLAHWAINNPIKPKTGTAKTTALLEQVYDELEERITALLALPVLELSDDALTQALAELGA